MSKNYKRLKGKAIELRKQGLSYREIQAKVSVAKSTLSLWLKDILLKPEHRKRLYTKQIQILSRGPQSQKERRRREIEKIIDKSQREIKLPIAEETLKLFGAALYWAEGSKTEHFSISNSDPYLILFMVQWLEKIFAVTPATLKVHLNIYPQQDEQKIKKFWSTLTGIPLANFGKSFTKPPNKGYKKNNLYFGTIKVRVPKGTNLRHRVFAWVQSALQDIAPKVQLTQKNGWGLAQLNAHP